MRLVLQRVTDARVRVDGKVVGEIDTGLLVLAGFGKNDDTTLPTLPAWKKIIEKLINLRIFADTDGKFNLSLADIGGDILLVSQFTLYADCRKGRRPSFAGACAPDVADALFEGLVADVRAVAPGKVETGIFGAEMFLDFTNWGPVTLVLDSEEM